MYSPYVKQKDGTFSRAELWWANGTHEMFSILKAEREIYPFPECSGVHYGMPSDVSEELNELYHNYYDKDDEDSFKWYPDVYYLYLADMKIYLLEHPELQDINEEYDENGKPPMTENYLKPLYDMVRAFYEVAGEFDFFEDKLSDLRIVYWVTH